MSKSLNFKVAIGNVVSIAEYSDIFKKTTQLVVSHNLRGYRLINLLSLVQVKNQIELFRTVPFEYQPVLLRGNT